MGRIAQLSVMVQLPHGDDLIADTMKREVPVKKVPFIFKYRLD